LFFFVFRFGQLLLNP